MSVLNNIIEQQKQFLADLLRQVQVLETSVKPGDQEKARALREKVSGLQSKLSDLQARDRG
jgi:polyhydroxyalkanoate synthesis regulator phasin